MTFSLMAPVIAFWGLAQIKLEASSADGRVPVGLFALLLFSLILFVALTVVFVWLARLERPETNARFDLVATRRVPSAAAGMRTGAAGHSSPADGDLITASIPLPRASPFATRPPRSRARGRRQTRQRPLDAGSHAAPESRHAPLSTSTILPVTLPLP